MNTMPCKPAFFTLAVSLLTAALAFGQATINDSQTAEPPGGEGSDWDFGNQRVVIGSGDEAEGSLLVPAGTEVLFEVLDLGVDSASASGYLEIDGEGAVVRTETDVPGDSELNVGMDGSGEIRIHNGGQMVSRSAWIALNAGSEGKMTVTGPGSRWDGLSGWSWRVGNQGFGILEVLDGASISGGNNLFVGNISIEDGDGEPVDGGVGEMLVEGGATATFDGNARIGNRPLTDGTVTVRGEGSLLSFGEFVHVGSGGQGTLIIEDGGSVVTGTESTNAALSIGAGQRDGEEEAVGHVHVTGAGSLLDIGSFIHVGRGRDGTLLVENGATVRGASNFRVGREETSVGEATFTGEGTLLDLDDYIHVGADGTGTMHVLDGARIEAPNNTFSIARVPGSEGILNVDGGAVIEVGSHLYDGREGTGEIHVTGGGQILADGQFYIARTDTATGHTTVSGEGSEIAVIGGDLRIATNPDLEFTGGSAAMTLADGGTVSTANDAWASGDSTILMEGGVLAAETGTITIQDTASLTGEGSVLGNLVVGPDATVAGSGDNPLFVRTLASGGVENVTLAGVSARLSEPPVTLAGVAFDNPDGNAFLDIVVDEMQEDLVNFDETIDFAGVHVTVTFDPGEPNRSLTFKLFNYTGPGEPEFAFADVSTPAGWELQDGVLLYTGAEPDPETAFEDWAASFGLEGDDAAPDANPAGDGFRNLEKFAFGADPTVPTATLVDFIPEGDTLTLRWNQRADGSAEYTVESSTDLDAESWETVPGAEPEVMADPDVTPPDGYERVEWTTEVDDAESRAFFRARSAVEADALP